MASRSSGGINFGDGHLSQSNVAATSGLCLRKPPHVAAHNTRHRTAQEDRHAQRPRLPIRLVGRRLMLVEAQQVERA
jgi:hypothetical protein